MIDNLRLTTDRNKEQDWLKTNLAAFHRHVAGTTRPRNRRSSASVRVSVRSSRAARRDLSYGGGQLSGHGACCLLSPTTAKMATRNISNSAKAWSASARQKSAAC